MYSACPSTKAMRSPEHRSASQYQRTCTRRRPQAFPVRLDGREELLRGGPEVLVDQDSALAVEDADVHRPGVQIDPAPMLVLAVVESTGLLRGCARCLTRFQPTPRGVGAGGGLE